MTQQDQNQDKTVLNENISGDVTIDLENEIERLEQEEIDIGESIDQVEQSNQESSQEIQILKDSLARAQADYQNLLRRVENERKEMSEFFTMAIVWKFLSTKDILERLVTKTPEDQRVWSLYEWVVSAEATMKKQLEGLGIRTIASLWLEPDHNFHDVITQIPNDQKGVILDEVEKGYLLNDTRVIRHAKVVVGA